MNKRFMFLVALVLSLSCHQQNFLASSIDKASGLSEVPIGYQSVKVSNFAIMETSAGMLQKGKQVRISISDHISQDMVFHPDFEIEIVGDLRIKNQGAHYLSGGTAGILNNQRDDVAYIYFDIERASTEPSIIKFSNLHVKIDRTIPISTVPYDLFVWGSAVTENFGTDPDQFSGAGIRIPYIMVVDSQTGEQYLDVFKEEAQERLEND